MRIIGFSLICVTIAAGVFFTTFDAQAKKKSGEVCQCTCFKDGVITRTWPVEPDSPQPLSPQTEKSKEATSTYEASYSSVPAPSYTPSKKKGASKTTDSTSSYQKTEYSKASSYTVTAKEDEGKKKSSKKNKPKEKEEKTPPPPAQKSKPKGSSQISFSQLQVLSGSVKVGDTEEQVRAALGEPYISTTTADNQGLWVYTEKKTTKGMTCEKVKWKLMFKKGRLKDWSEPKEDIFVGYCGE